MHLKELIIITFISALVTLFFTSMFVLKNLEQNFKDQNKADQAYVELIRSEIKGVIENKRLASMNQAFKGRDCGVCHYKNNNELPKNKIKYKYFECYLRGTCRWSINDDGMPLYDKNKINDTELRTLYEAIYN